jgi:hypothetical protein
VNEPREIVFPPFKVAVTSTVPDPAGTTNDQVDPVRVLVAATPPTEMAVMVESSMETLDGDVKVADSELPGAPEFALRLPETGATATTAFAW